MTYTNIFLFRVNTIRESRLNIPRYLISSPSDIEVATSLPVPPNKVPLIAREQVGRHFVSLSPEQGHLFLYTRTRYQTLGPTRASVTVIFWTCGRCALKFTSRPCNTVSVNLATIVTEASRRWEKHSQNRQSYRVYLSSVVRTDRPPSLRPTILREQTANAGYSLACTFSCCHLLF